MHGYAKFTPGARSDFASRCDCWTGQLCAMFHLVEDEQSQSFGEVQKLLWFFAKKSFFPTSEPAKGSPRAQVDGGADQTIWGTRSTPTSQPGDIYQTWAKEDGVIMIKGGMKAMFGRFFFSFSERLVQRFFRAPQTSSPCRSDVGGLGGIPPKGHRRSDWKTSPLVIGRPNERHVRLHPAPTLEIHIDFWQKPPGKQLHWTCIA